MSRKPDAKTEKALAAYLSLPAPKWGEQKAIAYTYGVQPKTLSVAYVRHRAKAK